MQNTNYLTVLCKWAGASAHPYLIADKATSNFNVYQYQSDFSAKLDWLVIGIQQWGVASAAEQTITYPVAVSKTYNILMTPKATTFRYAPWPSDVTARSFVAHSDIEPAYWMLIAKAQALQTATQAYGEGP